MQNAQSAEAATTIPVHGGPKLPRVTLKLSGDRPLLVMGSPPRSWAADVIDLTEVAWLTPFDIAALAVVWARLDAAGRPPEVVEPRDPALQDYLSRVGFMALIDGTRRAPGALGDQPLMRLTHLRAAEDWDEMLVDLWPAGVELPDAALTRRMVYILSELIDNATTHGCGSAGAFVVADRVPGAAGVWLAVADGGRGIPSHLRLNPRYREIAQDSDLIRLARRPAVTGTRDQRGWGLAEVLEQAAEVGPSQIVIRSSRGQGEFLLRPGQHPYARYALVRPAVPGTWVHVRLDAT